MTLNVSAAAADRVVERRRAIALARHYREFEGLSIGQIAQRLGRSPATIKAYFYDPTGEKARAVKVRYAGVPRLRCLHAAAQRQGRRLRVLQGLSSRRDPASVDPRAGHLGDAAVARALRPAAVILRLVAHPCPEARWGRASTPDGGPMPARQRRRRPVRNLGLGPYGRRDEPKRQQLAQAARSQPRSSVTGVRARPDESGQPSQRLIDSIGPYYRGRLFNARDEAKRELGELMIRALGDRGGWQRGRRQLDEEGARLTIRLTDERERHAQLACDLQREASCSPATTTGVITLPPAASAGRGGHPCRALRGAPTVGGPSTRPAARARQQRPPPISVVRAP